MKKLKLFVYCACSLLTLTVTVADESDGKPANPPKLGVAAQNVATSEETPSRNGGENAQPTLAQLDGKLKALETKLETLIRVLEMSKSDLVTKAEFGKMIDEKLAGLKPATPPTSKDAASKENAAPAPPSQENPEIAAIKKRLAGSEASQAGINATIERLDRSVQLIGGRLRIKGFEVADEKAVPSLVDEIAKEVENPRSRTAYVIVRNQTGEEQTFFVNGRESKIPANGATYEIDVKLSGSENTVLTQVWPYDKPKVRELTKINGRLEVPVNITWKRVQ